MPMVKAFCAKEAVDLLCNSEHIDKGMLADIASCMHGKCRDLILVAIRIACMVHASAQTERYTLGETMLVMV